MLTVETHFLFYFKTDKSDEESKCGHSNSDSESLRDSQYAWLSHKRKLHQSRKRQRAFRLTTARNEVGAR